MFRVYSYCLSEMYVCKSEFYFVTDHTEQYSLITKELPTRTLLVGEVAYSDSQAVWQSTPPKHTSVGFRE